MFILLIVACLIVSGCARPSNNNMNGMLAFGGLERMYITHPWHD